MTLIPAPSRQFKTWSFWLLMVAGFGDLVIVLLQSLTSLHVASGQTIAVIGAVLAFVTAASRFVLQNVPVTSEQKIELIQSAATLPVQPGHMDIAVQMTPVVEVMHEPAA